MIQQRRQNQRTQQRWYNNNSIVWYVIALGITLRNNPTMAMELQKSMSFVNGQDVIQKQPNDNEQYSQYLRKSTTSTEGQQQHQVQGRHEDNHRILSFQQVCYVCGSGSVRVTNTEQEIVYNLSSLTGPVQSTCGKLEQYGIEQGFFFLNQCFEAQEIVAAGNCNCQPIETIPTTTPAPVVSNFLLSIASFNRAPAPGPTPKSNPTTPTTTSFSLGSLQSSNSNNNPTTSTTKVEPSAAPIVVTYEPTPSPTTAGPTISAYPTVTSSPSHKTKCYVCGSSDLYVTEDPTAIVTVVSIPYTCAEIEQAGRTGLIAPGHTCNQYRKAVQQNNDICQCQSKQDLVLQNQLYSTLDTSLSNFNS